ncbi:MAG: transcription antitermination factor NusB [Gammaproteobacteria bacterium]|nr:transcription antitermination factor NusB [Gammaproteobacteria bacterium]MDH5629364.1 transcription antitermination factor NusB [Gammaproteobacteria bacterium]
MQKPSMRKKARRYAVQGLYQWHLSGNEIADIKKQFLETINPEKVDVEYFEDILVNTLNQISMLDDLFTPYLDRKFDEVNPVELAVLRLSAYELKERIDVPYKVVINEALELTKTFGASEAHKFVNGVVDKLAKKLRPMETKK